MVSNNKLELKVINCATIDSRQYRIEVETYPEGVNFDEAYVAFSGFFGPHGPHVFAAAPELLDALEHSQRLLERLGLQSSDEYQANSYAIAKAKGETE